MMAHIASFGYHDVTDHPAASGFQRPGARPYRLTPTAFAAHLAALGAAWSPPKLIGDIDLAQPGRHVLLTFDDGGKSALRTGDALAARGWKGHFFIVTSLIGQRTFLESGEIRYLRECGHVIGSHTHTHPNLFRELAADVMLEEWRASCDRLAQLLGEPCDVASVPGGDMSASVQRSAAQAGVHFLFTSEPTIIPTRSEGSWMLGRFIVKAGVSAARVAELAQLRGWGQAMLLRRVKLGVRRLLPGMYRQLVRQRTVQATDAGPPAGDLVRNS
jgi:peptidoglycan/xylan/chitin deacetylase (PgdA/CDA1 family)